MTIQSELNLQIANWSILYTKLHRFHWYVKGPHSSLFMLNLKNFMMNLHLWLIKWLNVFLLFKVNPLQR